MVSKIGLILHIEYINFVYTIYGLAKLVSFCDRADSVAIAKRKNPKTFVCREQFF